MQSASIPSRPFFFQTATALCACGLVWGLLCAGVASAQIGTGVAAPEPVPLEGLSRLPMTEGTPEFSPPPIADHAPLSSAHAAPRSQTFFDRLPTQRWSDFAPRAGNALPDYAPQAQDGYWYHYGGKARSYYLNDQRIEFTGEEATFAVEGVVSGGIHHQSGDWDYMVETEIFLNQPFDKNILSDIPERTSFVGNFQIDPLQISQLYLGARKNDWFFSVGRMPTVFGRYYYSNFLNNFADSPFIRSEAILYRETGALIQWDPEGYVFTLGWTNGSLGQDTNSSKAVLGRAGIDRENFALGASIKWQDGIGSEKQKQFNNHVGVDAMYRVGRWTLSSEAIYDQYGFRQAGFDPNNIFWGRSIYFRDINKAHRKPAIGYGYYLNLGYRGERYDVQFSYGDYFPDKVGIPAQDTPTHRAVLKTSRFLTPHFEVYNILLIENTVPIPIETNRFRTGIEVILGAQFSL